MPPRQFRVELRRLPCCVPLKADAASPAPVNNACTAWLTHGQEAQAVVSSGLDDAGKLIGAEEHACLSHLTIRRGRQALAVRATQHAAIPCTCRIRATAAACDAQALGLPACALRGWLACGLVEKGQQSHCQCLGQCQELPAHCGKHCRALTQLHTRSTHVCAQGLYSGFVPPFTLHEFVLACAHDCACVCMCAFVFACMSSIHMYEGVYVA